MYFTTLNACADETMSADNPNVAAATEVGAEYRYKTGGSPLVDATRDDVEHRRPGNNQQEQGGGAEQRKCLHRRHRFDGNRAERRG
jgi:hypothetical protein